MPVKKKYDGLTSPDNLVNKLNIKPGLLKFSKPSELTIAQRSKLLNVKSGLLSKPLILCPNHSRIGKSYLAFNQPLLVSSSPQTFSPDTGCAVFNTNAADASVEIGFVPVNANKPHLIEINIGLLLFDKMPKSYQFHTKMFTGENPIPEKDFSFNSDQQIVLVFPAVTQKLNDDLLVVELTQKGNPVNDLLWALFSVKITSVM
ncbi:MAG: hypothetical protein ABIN97_00380 [Ginsengibacter sp.]